MLLKQFIYNDYNLELYEDGKILFRARNLLYKYNPIRSITTPIIDIADVPILNELQKDLLEYYVEWKKNNINSVIENLGKIYGRNS